MCKISSVLRSVILLYVLPEELLVSLISDKICNKKNNTGGNFF